MKIAEFRDLLTAVSNGTRQLQSAVKSHEQREAAMSLRLWVEALFLARCNGASDAELIRQDDLIRIAGNILARKKSEFDKADAAYSAAAFGGMFK